MRIFPRLRRSRGKDGKSLLASKLLAGSLGIIISVWAHLAERSSVLSAPGFIIAFGAFEERLHTRFVFLSESGPFT